MKCTTVVQGSVCHRTSTPHKSGNKMKEKKNGMDMLNGKGDDDWVKLCTKLVGREQLVS